MNPGLFPGKIQRISPLTEYMFKKVKNEKYIILARADEVDRDDPMTQEEEDWLKTLNPAITITNYEFENYVPPVPVR